MAAAVTATAAPLGDRASVSSTSAAMAQTRAEHDKHRQARRTQRKPAPALRSSSADSVASQTHEQYTKQQAAQKQSQRQASAKLPTSSGAAAAPAAATWLDDELCSVCSAPVPLAGSLYCSSECRHQDARAGSPGPGAHETLAFDDAPSSHASAAAAHFFGLDSARIFASDAAGPQQFDGLRYAALGSPRSRPAQPPHYTHRKRASLGSAATGAQTTTPLSPRSQYTARLARRASAKQGPSSVSARWADIDPTASAAAKQSQQANAQQQRVQRSSSSSSGRSSLSEDESPAGPTTPSPHLWARSAPHAHVDEPSALMLPPSLQLHDAEMRALQKSPSASATLRLRSAVPPRSSDLQQTSPQQMSETLPTPSILSKFMRYTRRPSSTNVPAPILFSSPVLAAINKVTAGGTAGSKSPANALVARKASGTTAPATATAINGLSGDETSDLDLADGEHSPGSSGFDLDRSAVLGAAPPSAPAAFAAAASHLASQQAQARRSPLVNSIRLPSPALTPAQPSTSVSSVAATASALGSHHRMPSDSVLSSVSRAAAAAGPRPSVSHAVAVPIASATPSAAPANAAALLPGLNTDVSIAPSVPTTVAEVTESSASDSPQSKAPFSEARQQPEPQPAAEVQQHDAAPGPRGRSKARGPRSSSRRRSPSPPRRGDRRRSRAPSDPAVAAAAAVRGRSGAEDDDAPLPGAAVPLGLDGDEAQEVLFSPLDDAPEDDEEQRARGRQGTRFGLATRLPLPVSGRRGSRRFVESICEQAFPGYGHDDA